MQMSGNTILITGGGSGIGRGLAETFQVEKNQVIIAGRRKDVLDETVKANPGMKAAVLDIEDKDAIPAFAKKLVKDFPALNVVIHNAGIMRPEPIQKTGVADAEAIIATNLLGPIRLTAALLPHLLKQPRAAIITVSSGLAFLPLAMTPTYCATKAAIHSWTQSLRYQLRDTPIDVLEIAPPYVQTELNGPQQAADPRAMPLAEYIAETISLLENPPASGEILVERVLPLRWAEKNGNFEQIFQNLNGSFHEELLATSRN